MLFPLGWSSGWLCVYSLVCAAACSRAVGGSLICFPVPGMWACVISGWYAWIPCLWGLVFEWVAGSSMLWTMWWF